VVVGLTEQASTHGETDALREVVTGWASRKAKKVPPGHNDDGPGDYVIWQTMMRLAKRIKRDVLFVSGDVKNDWYVRSSGKPLYIQYELIDEFRRVSNGQNFDAVVFSDFLRLFKQSEKVVSDAEDAEHRQVVSISVSAVVSGSFSSERSTVVGDPSFLQRFEEYKTAPGFSDVILMGAEMPQGQIWMAAKRPESSSYEFYGGWSPTLELAFSRIRILRDELRARYHDYDSQLMLVVSHGDFPQIPVVRRIELERSVRLLP
jgi:hypothetical protein